MALLFAKVYLPALVELFQINSILVPTLMYNLYNNKNFFYDWIFYDTWLLYIANE